jgi:uncharacterized membrane protein YphA (DoxX/SURF4 family)
VSTSAEVTAALAASGRICLGFIFVTAGLGKLRHGRVFEGVVANYRVLPQWAAPWAARALPPAEVALGLALAAQIGEGWPAAAGIALLLVFAWAMSVNLRRGRTAIDCGCHQSALRQTLSWPLIGRNLVLALLLAPGVSAAPTAPALIWLSLPVGAAAYLVYLLFNSLSALSALNRNFA